MGMVASEEYVRTSRQVVFTIQRAVNRSIVTGFDHEYFEDEAIERLCKAAENAGANPNRIRKRHAVTSSLTGKSCLGGTYPTLEVTPEDWFEVDGNEVDEATLATSIIDQKSKHEAAEKQPQILCHHLTAHIVSTAPPHRLFCQALKLH